MRLRLDLLIGILVGMFIGGAGVTFAQTDTVSNIFEVAGGPYEFQISVDQDKCVEGVCKFVAEVVDADTDSARLKFSQVVSGTQPTPTPDNTQPTPTPDNTQPTPTPASEIYIPLVVKSGSGGTATPIPSPTPSNGVGTPTPTATETPGTVSCSKVEGTVLLSCDSEGKVGDLTLGLHEVNVGNKVVELILFESEGKVEISVDRFDYDHVVDIGQFEINGVTFTIREEFATPTPVVKLVCGEPNEILSGTCTRDVSDYNPNIYDINCSAEDPTTNIPDVHYIIGEEFTANTSSLRDLDEFFSYYVKNNFIVGDNQSVTVIAFNDLDDDSLIDENEFDPNSCIRIDYSVIDNVR